MQKLLSKVTTIGVLISVIIVIFDALVALIVFDIISTPIFIDLTLVLVVAVAIFALLFATYILIASSILSKARKKNDISAVEIVGEDIQEVYNYGQIGLILTDINNNVIWTNDWFEGIQAKIVDHNIFEWKKELASLKEKEDGIIELELDNRIYSVKYLKEANLYIFKDVSEVSTLTNYAREHSPVVGIMQIDDYQDVISVLDESKVNDLVIAIQKNIFDYAKEFKFLIRKLRSDTFSFIATYEQYQKMMSDDFSILNRIKAIDVFNSSLEMTLSIGIGLGTDDYVRLNDMATSCINVCLSRGGDQVVIQPFGEKLIFIGGRTESKAGSSNVKMRVLSKSLETQVQTYDKIYIMGHRDMDMDALGSCLGVYCFAKHFGRDARIVYDEKYVEQKTRKAFKTQFHDLTKMITISPKECIEEIKELEDHALLILCDHHSAKLSLSSEVTLEANKIAVIDHHRRGEEFIDSPTFAYIDPAASSASEIVTEIIKYNEKHIEIPEKISSIMLAGILLDTNYYRNKTSDKTYEASVVLKDCGADNLLADSFLKEDYAEYFLKIKIMATAQTPYFGVVVCTSEEEDIIDRTMLSMVAQDTLGIDGISACFVIGRTGEEIVGISSRSDGTINVQFIMEKMGGGGHFAAAAAQIKGQSINDVKEKLLEVLRLYITDAKAENK
ncbi:MAG: DHH family phosphoesterase [Bacillales bacterium]|nr:DHH family phosphoesterase [Bacillales bacterium]